jgi:RNase adapter protein RapZ
MKAQNSSSPEANSESGRRKTVVHADLVIITGMSGSGKATALKAFEDLGFYAVDNLPILLISKFADLTRDSKTKRKAALAIDIREGESLSEFPEQIPLFSAASKTSALHWQRFEISPTFT